MTTRRARRRLRELAAETPDRSALAGRWSRPRWPGRFDAFRAARPDADDHDHAALLEAVARAMRGGLSLRSALGEAAAGEADRSPGRALVRLAPALEAGLGLTEVIDRWMADDAGDGRQLAGLALSLGAQLGGASARSLDAATASLRDRAQLGREVRALGAQARASAWVMVLAPVAFAAFTSATDHRVAAVLLGSPLGWACMAVGLGLDGAGALWMRRLARRVT